MWLIMLTILYNICTLNRQIKEFLHKKRCLIKHHSQPLPSSNTNILTTTMATWMMMKFLCSNLSPPDTWWTRLGFGSLPSTHWERIRRVKIWDANDINKVWVFLFFICWHQTQVIRIFTNYKNICIGKLNQLC